jgi:hypothetical protein
LEAYKRGIHKAIGFGSAMSMIQNHALLSDAEVDRLHLDRRFGNIERALIGLIMSTGSDTKVNLSEYSAWLAGVRALEKAAQDQQGDWPQLRDIYAQMQRYEKAAEVSSWFNDSEAEARYTELAKTDPQEPKGYLKILRRIEDDYEESHRPHVTFPPKE